MSYYYYSYHEWYLLSLGPARSNQSPRNTLMRKKHVQPRDTVEQGIIEKFHFGSVKTVESGILAENTKRPKDDTYAVKSKKSLTWAEVVKCK